MFRAESGIGGGAVVGFQGGGIGLGVDGLMKSLWRVNVGYVFREMKRLKGCDGWNWGSISLKLAQVTVYLQDEWGRWRLRGTLTCFDHFDCFSGFRLKELLFVVSMNLSLCDKVVLYVVYTMKDDEEASGS